MTARRSVLIVDDMRPIVEMLSALVEEEGYTPHGATTREEALAELEREKPDVAVLDLRMPDISGKEVARRLRERWGPQVPILLMSADPNLQEEAIAMDAQAVVRKPFDIEVFLLELHRLMESRRGQRAHAAHR